jgi:hypothetical protein
MMKRCFAARPIIRGALCAAAFLMSAVPGFSRENDAGAVKLVRSYEDKLDLGRVDLTSTFTLVQQKPGEADRVLRVKVYRRDRIDSYTLIYLYPDSEKGKGYLRAGDDLFQYFPSTREFVYRNRREDIGGTDARADLFAKPKTLELYTLSSLGTAKVAQWDCDVVRYDAKALDVSFPIQKWFVRRTDGLPVKVENFSVSETLMRTYYYVGYAEVTPGRFLFTKLLAVDNLQPGQKTLLTNEDIGTAKIADYVFTKAFLEEQSR